MKNFLKIAIVFILGIVLYACSKDNDTFKGEEGDLNRPAPTYFRVESCFVESDNPYNYYGTIHNEVIQQFVTEYPKGIRDLKDLSRTIDAMVLNNDNYREMFGTKNAPINSELLQEGMRDFDNNFHNMIEKLDVSNLTKDKLKELCDFMIAEANAEVEPDYNRFDSQLANFERRIMESRDFDQEETRILLSSTSVARNSSCFWQNYYNSRHVARDGEAKGGRKWWQWAIVGVADVAGTFLGGGANVGTGIAASGVAHTYTDPEKK